MKGLAILRRPEPAADPAAELLAAAREADDAAKALAAALERRAEALRAYQRTNGWRPHLIAKALQRRPVDSGLSVAGLGDYATIEYVGNAGRRSFAQQAVALLGATAREGESHGSTE